MKEEPLSPCTGLCKLDINQYCRGCGRSVQEISEWWRLSNAEKLEIMQRLAHAGFAK